MKNAAPRALLRSRGGESEKIMINLGPVDLGQIDLLVEEGFYSNRTDLIRTAIRNQLAVHATAMRETIERRALVLGMWHFSRDELEAIRAAHERLNIQVLGLASIADDVSSRSRQSKVSWCLAPSTSLPPSRLHSPTGSASQMDLGTHRASHETERRLFEFDARMANASRIV